MDSRAAAGSGGDSRTVGREYGTCPFSGPTLAITSGSAGGSPVGGERAKEHRRQSALSRADGGASEGGLGNLFGDGDVGRCGSEGRGVSVASHETVVKAWDSRAAAAAVSARREKGSATRLGGGSGGGGGGGDGGGGGGGSSAFGADGAPPGRS